MPQVARNTLVPAWQERLGFNDVALGDTVSLAIFDHKKLTSDVFLGQVTPGAGLAALQLLHTMLSQLASEGCMWACHAAWPQHPN